MKNYAKNVLIVILSILVMTAPAFATEEECRSVLRDCDSALTAQQNVNALQKQIIADQDSRYDLVQKQLNSASIWKPIAEGAIVVVILESLVLVFRK